MQMLAAALKVAMEQMETMQAKAESDMAAMKATAAAHFEARAQSDKVVAKQSSKLSKFKPIPKDTQQESLYKTAEVWYYSASRFEFTYGVRRAVYYFDG